MRRSWVLLPVSLVALLLCQLDVPTLPSGYVDPVALAAATTAAGWHCILPKRARSVALRSPGRPPLTMTEAQLAAAGPPTDSEPGRPKLIPGLGAGPGKNPSAQITGGLRGPDNTASFQIPLRAGDVLGATVTGAAQQLQVRDPRGTLVEGSATDRATSYPKSSPLPGGGTATVDHVAAETGTYTLTVRQGTGSYQASIMIVVPPTRPQRIFLDFSGTSIDTRIFGVDTGGAQPRKLSPLRSFLARWGLPDSAEPALIEKITDTVTANLRAAGASSPIEVTDSARSPNQWGRPDVSRVVIGGTAAEAGIDTVGISESVDPGNFDREETALVLLGDLSAPPDQLVSLNHYLSTGGDRLNFIAHAVGNIASHEAGHFLGSWHTDPNSGRHDLMAPGDLIGAFGLGPSGVAATPDATQSKFGQDTFDPSEGFTGTEDTRTRTQVGLDGTSPSPAR